VVRIRSPFVKTFLGVPHTATQDGYIAGYSIPKGSIIIANLWLDFFLLVGIDFLCNLPIQEHAS